MDQSSLAELQKLDRSLRSYDSGERTLVVGGAGYIGSLLVRRLLYRGRRVRVLDRLDFSDDSLRELYRNPRFELIDADLRDARSLHAALTGVDSVVHLAAVVGDAACEADQREAVEVNVNGVELLADAAKSGGVKRLVFASTCSVYGASAEVASETTAPNPVSLYARSKLEAERLLLRQRDERFQPVILRVGTVFGYSPRPRFDLVVNLLTAKAHLGRKATVYNGERWRPFVHVDDVARGFELALEAQLSSVGGEILNLGSSNHRLREIGEAIRAAHPGARIAEEANADARDYRADFSKAQRLLDFRPKTTLEAGIRELDSALAQGLIADPEAERYHNHRRVRASHAQAAI